MEVGELLKNYGIGLTGGIATGKSTVAHFLRAQGYLVIDADQLARQVVAPGSLGLSQLVAAFGQDILRADGQLDRAKLRQLAFNNPSMKMQLEAITHPLIRDALANELAQRGLTTKPRPFFYEAALLFETGTANKLHAIWATHCPLSKQLARIIARDGAQPDEAQRTLAQQMPAAEKAALATLAIDTDCTLEELAERVKTALAVQFHGP